MSEILTEYFKGFKNYFKNFNKSKFYKLLGIVILIVLLICFNIISIPCYICYRYGVKRTEKRLKDTYNRDNLNYLTGIHTSNINELISISEVELKNPK